jgi:hypothetical protein
MRKPKHAMRQRDVFFITRAREDLDEEPPWDLVLKVTDLLKAEGYDLRYSQERSYLFDKIVEGIREHGITHYTDAVPLLEAVLPDGTRQEEHLDLLRSMLRTIAPKRELLLIDPYLFPTGADPDYVPYLNKVFGPAFRKITSLEIVTLRKRSKAVETAFLTMVSGLGGGITTKVRYTSAFHDRFWIADGKRGLFVGTSLNGIGRRYAIADYLRKRDVRDIYARFRELP